MKAILSLILLFSVLTSNARDYKKEAVTVKSAIFKNGIELIVFRPVMTKASEPIQFIYMLDGELNNDRFKQLGKFFNDNESDNIIVNFKSITGISRFDILRVKKEFQNSLETEIIPAVEKDLKVVRRFIIGHQEAATFELYSLSKTPYLFDRYYCINPSPFNKYIKARKFKVVNNYLMNHPGKAENKIGFLISYPQNDSLKLESGTKKLISFIKTNKYDNIRFVIEKRNFGAHQIDR